VGGAQRARLACAPASYEAGRLSARKLDRASAWIELVALDIDGVAHR